MCLWFCLCLCLCLVYILNLKFWLGWAQINAFSTDIDVCSLYIDVCSTDIDVCSIYIDACSIDIDVCSPDINICWNTHLCYHSTKQDVAVHQTVFCHKNKAVFAVGIKWSVFYRDFDLRFPFHSNTGTKNSLVYWCFRVGIDTSCFVLW